MNLTSTHYLQWLWLVKLEPLDAQRPGNIRRIVSLSQRNTLLQKHLRTPAGDNIPIRCKLPQPITEGVIGPINVNVTTESLQEKVNEYNDKNPIAKIQKFNRIQKYNKGETQDPAFYQRYL